MNRLKYVFLVREEFIEARYRSFLEKRALLEAVDPDHRFFILSDLDASCGFGEYPERTLADIVLCDACNEDIRENRFILLDRSRCYHIDCAQDRSWFNRREMEMLVDAKSYIGNVVPINIKSRHNH